MLKKEEIVKDKKKKNQDIAEFIERDYNRLIRYIRRKKRNTSYMEAEDILGDVILSVLKLVNFGTIIDNIPSYIYGSIKNKIIDISRKRKTRNTVFVEEIDENSFMFVNTIKDMNKDVLEKMELKELHELIFKAVDSLSDKLRNIWVATEIEGISYFELSEELNVPENTLCVRKNRANKKIREYIEKFYEKRRKL